ncbi:MAG TPA: MFS transporter [Longilinea sp.]|nr:MFS transporter [Longilinea sp.]
MKNPQPRLILALACASFLGLGVVSAGLGPALSELAAKSSSSLGEIGGLFSALFFGSLVTQIVTGLLLDRLGPRWLILSGLLIVAVGFFGVALAAELPLMVASAAFAGLGHGTINVVMNVSISNLFSQKRASTLNLLNVFFGLGAIIAPAIAGLSLRLVNSSLPAIWFGAGLELVLLPLFFWLFHSPVPSGDHPASQSSSRNLLRSPALWLLGILLLLYVGSENGAGGWVSTYMQQTTTLTAASAALAASGFWLAYTAGRMAAAWLGTRWSVRLLLTTSLGIAFMGGLVIFASTGSAPISILGFLLLGFGFGPIYPTMLAVITDTFSHSSGAAASLAIAMGSTGGMLIPWLQGIILEGSGPRAAALLLPIATLLMLVCLMATRRARRREAAGVTLAAGADGQGNA